MPDDTRNVGVGNGRDVSFAGKRHNRPTFRPGGRRTHIKTTKTATPTRAVAAAGYPAGSIAIEGSSANQVREPYRRCCDQQKGERDDNTHPRPLFVPLNRRPLVI